MADTADTLLKILETVMHSQTQLVEVLTRLEDRQQEHNRALAQAIGDDTRLLAKGIEDNSRALAQMINDSHRILAEILDRVVQTTSRSEQMTARILTEISGRGAVLRIACKA